MTSPRSPKKPKAGKGRTRKPETVLRALHEAIRDGFRRYGLSGCQDQVGQRDLLAELRRSLRAGEGTR